MAGVDNRRIREEISAFWVTKIATIFKWNSIPPIISFRVSKYSRMSPHLARHNAVRKKQRYYDHFLSSDDCTLYCSRNINSRQRNIVAMWITLLHLRHTARDCSPFHEMNRLHMKLVRIERNDERFFVRNFLWIIATHESNEHERQQCSVFTGQYFVRLTGWCELVVLTGGEIRPK